MKMPCGHATSLPIRQGYPLKAKIFFAQKAIKKWHKKYKGQVAITFSDTENCKVLVHLVRSILPDVPVVFLKQGESIDAYGKPFISTRAGESLDLANHFAAYGDNAFAAHLPTSRPLSSWVDADVAEYIKVFNLL